MRSYWKAKETGQSTCCLLVRDSAVRAIFFWAKKFLFLRFFYRPILLTAHTKTTDLFWITTTAEESTEAKCYSIVSWFAQQHSSSWYVASSRIPLHFGPGPLLFCAQSSDRNQRNQRKPLVLQPRGMWRMQQRNTHLLVMMVCGSGGVLPNCPGDTQACATPGGSSKWTSNARSWSSFGLCQHPRASWRYIEIPRKAAILESRNSLIVRTNQIALIF